jgi:hypothetical protein
MGLQDITAQPQQAPAPQPQAEEQAGGDQKTMEVISQLLNSVVDEKTYQAFRQIAQHAGLDVGEMPPHYDPQFIEQGKQELGMGGQQSEAPQAASGILGMTGGAEWP